jgi:hypothetical protein
MDSKSPIVVYWSPPYKHQQENGDLHPLVGRESNIYYKNPNSLFMDLIKDKSEESKNKSFFACPAVSKKFKNTYIFKSPMSSKYYIDFTDKDNIVLTSPNLNDPCIPVEISRNYSVENSPIMLFHFPIFLFSEEPLEINLTAPYFHEPKILKYGAVIPGGFDIGQWFRPIHYEVNFWKEKQEIEIIEDEPLFYVEFLTDRPVILKRFIQNKNIHDLQESISGTTTFMEKNVPLIKRYKRFKESSIREILLKEIKKEVVE